MVIDEPLIVTFTLIGTGSSLRTPSSSIEAEAS